MGHARGTVLSAELGRSLTDVQTRTTPLLLRTVSEGRLKQVLCRTVVRVLSGNHLFKSFPQNGAWNT